MGLGSSTTGVVLINGKDRQAGEVAVHEDGVRRLQAKEHQGMTSDGHHRKLRGTEGCHRVAEGIAEGAESQRDPANTSLWGVQPPERGEDAFLLF